MKPALQKLVALQEHDTRLADVERALQELPARLRRGQERVAQARAALEVARQRLRDLELARRDGEREVDALMAQEKRYQGQTMQVKTNEELWALKREIEVVQGRRSELETSVLLRMDDEETGRREIARLERLAEEAAATLARDTEAAEEERRRLDAERARLDAEREALAAEVSPELRTRYERVRAGRGNPAVVTLMRNACGACLTAQPPQRVQEARGGEVLVVCEFCGRLIVGVEGA